jgi:hypothetical protein
MTRTLVGTPDPEPRPVPEYSVTTGSTSTVAAGFTTTWSPPPHTVAARALPDPHDAVDHVCDEDCHGWTWET